MYHLSSAIHLRISSDSTLSLTRARIEEEEEGERKEESLPMMISGQSDSDI